MDIWVFAAKFIYGNNTKKMSYIKLFWKSRVSMIYWLNWMRGCNLDAKIIYTLEPEMIIELVKFPRSRSICKISPNTKPNTARFKRTALNSAIACLNKADLALTGLIPAKFKKGFKKVKLNEKASDKILKDLHKSTERKMRPIINKKYPGANFKPSYDDDGINKYEDLVNLFDPPENVTLEQRISEMEEHLNSILDEELFSA